MKYQKKHIPIHKLNDEKGVSLKILNQEACYQRNERIIFPHRDVFHLFILHEKGNSKLVVDFEEVQLSNNTIFYILPGQVHYYVPQKENITVWLLAIDPLLIDDEYKVILEENITDHKPLQIENIKLTSMNTCVKLLHSLLLQESLSSIHTSIISHLTKAFVGMVANIYLNQRDKYTKKHSRQVTITL